MCVCVSNFLFKNVQTQNRVEFNKSCMGESSSSSNSNQLRNNVITSLYHQHKLVQNILWDLNMRYEWSDDALTNKSIIINRCWKLIRFFSLFFLSFNRPIDYLVKKQISINGIFIFHFHIAIIKQNSRWHAKSMTRKSITLWYIGRCSCFKAQR